MKLRKHLLMFLTFVLAITAVLGLVFVPVNSVKAEEAEAFDFGVKSSVSIRGGKDEGLNPKNEVGIRFHVEIAPSYYETISANENFAFGVLIGPKEYYDYKNGDFKVDDDYLANISYVNKDWVFTDKNLNANGNYEYVASVLYNRDLLVADIEEELAINPDAFGGETNVDALVKCAYAKKLVAVPYVVYGDSVEYRSVSKATSAAHVANAGLLSGKVSMELASRYLNKVIDIDGLFIEEDGTLVGAYANEFTLADNASSISIAGSFEALDTSFRTIDTIADERGIVKFNNDAFANQTRELGAYYQLSVYDKYNNVYRLNYQYVTNAIDSADEFIEIFAWKKTMVQGEFGGYYVLADNIDATGKVVDNDSYDANTTNYVEFTGTFDGQGKVISNLTIAKEDSLFPRLRDAVIKNFALDNLTANGAKLISTKTTADSYVRNIYVKYADGSTDPVGLYYNASNNPWTDNFVIDYGSNNPIKLSATANEAGQYSITNSTYNTVSAFAASRLSFAGLFGLFAGATNFPGNNKHVSNFVIFSEYNVPIQYTPSDVVFAKNVKYDVRGYASEDYLIEKGGINVKYTYASYSRSYKDRAAMRDAYNAVKDDEEAYKAEFETGGGAHAGFALSQFDTMGEGCWKMVDGVPYWKELYTKASATVGGVEVLTSSLELTSSEDEVKLSFTNNDQKLNVMSGEELQEGEYKAECFSDYLTLTKNEDNTYSAKLAKKVGLTQNAIITLTALINGEEVERTVKIKLNASTFVLGGTLNGEDLSETITLTSDSDALNLNLISAYDSKNFILNKDNKLEDGEYEFEIDDKDLEKILLTTNEDGSISISLNPDCVQNGLIAINFAVNVDDIILEKAIELNVNFPSRKELTGRAYLDASTGLLYYNGQLVEGINYVNYHASEATTFAYGIAAVDGKIVNKLTGEFFAPYVYMGEPLGSAGVFHNNSRHINFLIQYNASGDYYSNYTNAVYNNTTTNDFSASGFIVIRTASGEYKITDFIPATKVLKTKEDLAVFNTADSEGNKIEVNNNGYYVLLNDIDATNFKPTHYSGIIADLDGGLNTHTYGFHGVLNGDGHAIYNLDLTPTPTVLDNPETEEDETFYGNPGVGLFGYGSDALVQNLAFINATTNYSYLFAYYNPYNSNRTSASGTGGQYGPTFNDAKEISTMTHWQDVYVKYSNETKFPLGFAKNLNGRWFGMKNVIVEAPGVVSHEQTEGVWATVKTSKMADTTVFALINAETEGNLVYQYYPSLIYAREPGVYNFNLVNVNGTTSFNKNNYIIGNSNVGWSNNDKDMSIYAKEEQMTYDGKYLTIWVNTAGTATWVKPSETITEDQIFGYYGEDRATYQGKKLYYVKTQYAKFNNRTALTSTVTDFSAFSTKCWTITANGPVWKGLAE